MPPAAKKATPKKPRASAAKKAKATDVAVQESSSICLGPTPTIASVQMAPDVAVPKAADFDQSIRFKASRAISRKLKCYDEDVVGQARNSLGQSVMDFVCVEYAAAANASRNVLNDFWDVVAKEFNLACESLEKRLPKIEATHHETHQPDPELGPLFATVHGKNPSARVPAVGMVERRLKICGPLPRLLYDGSACALMYILGGGSPPHSP